MAYLETALYWGLPCLGLLFLLGGVGSLSGKGGKPPARVASTPPPTPLMASEDNLRAGDAGEARVDAVLATMKGLERLSHFSFEVPGEHDPSAKCQVDHVIKGHDRLWILETKNWAGTVLRTHGAECWLVRRSASEEVDERHSPVEQAKHQARRLSAVTGLPVDSLVVMAGSAVCVAGKWPYGVVSLSDLASRLGGLARSRQPDSRGVSSAEVGRGWTKAKELAALDADGSVSRAQAVRAATLKAVAAARHAPSASSAGSTDKDDTSAGGMLIAAILCGVAWWYLPVMVAWMSPPPPPAPVLVLPQAEAPLPIPPVPPSRPPPSRPPTDSRRAGVPHRMAVRLEPMPSKGTLAAFAAGIAIIQRRSPEGGEAKWFMHAEHDILHMGADCGDISTEEEDGIALQALGFHRGDEGWSWFT